MIKYYMPAKIFAGSKSVETNSELFGSLGSCCLILTGASSAVKSGALADVTAALEAQNINFSVFNEIGSNPLLTACMLAGKAAVEAGADFIIGIGGGSVLDAAKAAAVFASNPELDEAAFYSTVWPVKPLPVVLVGTTSGTGSEVTKVAVLTDSRGRKHSLHDNRLYACASFGDPAYTMSLPLKVTLSTGIDIFAHCAESFFSKKADSLTKSFAVEGIRLLYAPLLAAAEGKELSFEQREQLYEASVFGGLAINATGTCFPHNMGYYLTESFGIPHGFACNEFIPDMLEYVKTAAPETAEEFYSLIGIPEDKLLELSALCSSGASVCLSEAEIEALLPRWENNGSVKNTLGSVSTQEIRSILKKHFLK